MLITITQTQLLLYPGEFRLSLKLKIVGYFLGLIFAPFSFFKKPAASFGQRLTRCLEELGPMYIKFGQTLSTRPDLIGIRVAEELKYLQQRLPPFDFGLVKQLIYKACGQTVDELFTVFTEIPVAAASIAQVHKAELTTGEVVAVKILRPGIHKTYSKDLQMLHLLATWSSGVCQKLKRLKLTEIIDTLKLTMNQELDLRLEAAAAAEMSANFKDDQDIYIPMIYWQLTHATMLVTEWIDGVSIYDNKQLLELGVDLTVSAKKIAIMFLNQAYRDGFFHADLHPGNILIKNSGEIVLLDFGIMGRLAEQDKLAVAEILAAFLKHDYNMMAQVHLRAGYIPKQTNIYLFAQKCRAVCEPIIGLAAKDISVAKLLAQLFKITEDFGMEVQIQLLLLQKTMVVVEGIGHSLDPNINMWALAEPWIKKWEATNLSVEAKIRRLFRQVIAKYINSLAI